VWRVAAVAGFVLAVGAAFLLGQHVPSVERALPGQRPTPNVVMAVRDLSRLESASYHMEKVIELTDTQSRIFGLVQAKDALLLVAVADVVAGVDLSRVGDADVAVDAVSGAVRVRLPAPEVFSCTIDQSQTHVVARSTDVLAARNEQLEGTAREAAEKQLRQGAIDAGILDRAHTVTERTVRDLLGSLGFAHVDVQWGG
jgi:hypothetical protein